MTDRDPLKAAFAFGILPGNIEYVGADVVGFDREPLQLIVIGGNRLAVDPGAMRYDSSPFWLNSLNGFKLNMSLGRTLTFRRLIL